MSECEYAGEEGGKWWKGEGEKEEGRKEGGGGVALITRTPYLGYGEKFITLRAPVEAC